jgi:hypothetical protein
MQMRGGGATLALRVSYVVRGLGNSIVWPSVPEPDAESGNGDGDGGGDGNNSNSNSTGGGLLPPSVGALLSAVNVLGVGLLATIAYIFRRASARPLPHLAPGTAHAE